MQLKSIALFSTSLAFDLTNREGENSITSELNKICSSRFIKSRRNRTAYCDELIRVIMRRVQFEMLSHGKMMAAAEKLRASTSLSKTVHGVKILEPPTAPSILHLRVRDAGPQSSTEAIAISAILHAMYTVVMLKW